MTKLAAVSFFVLFALMGTILVLFLVYSFIEKEWKAFRRGTIILLIICILVSILSFLPESIYRWLIIATLLIPVILLLKFGNTKIDFPRPEERFDERDVMFSRNTLKKGSENYIQYYKLRPENKGKDDKFREGAGLMEKGAAFYNELLFNAARSTFQTVDLLHSIAEKQASEVKTTLSETAISEFIKNWTLKLGALDVGFTKLQPHHIYTHVGRGGAYGNEVDLKHKYAIAFTVEMDHEALSYNPRGPVLMESAKQYLKAGQIAVQLAQFLRNLGFDSRAHIDANYRVICPIVAQDAGLGIIGRMGLLMTPKYGPRVRIGVVSTELQLPVHEKFLDYSAIHFCEVCKKCAENCPSQSIPYHSELTKKHPQRWTINHENCFTYWCKTGTDCGRCLAVCPFSHPDNFIHNIVRWMIKRNPINRWLAIKLDNFFYGRKPTAKSLQGWMMYK